jgi:hypothetical protein
LRRISRQKLRISDWKRWQVKVKTTQFMNNLSGFWIEMPKFSNFELLEGRRGRPRLRRRPLFRVAQDKRIEFFLNGI